jgi:thioredoxin 1
LATENEGKSKVGKIDVTQNMELAVKYGIAAVPTILVFKGGEVVERLQGYKEKDELQALLDTHSTSA